MEQTVCVRSVVAAAEGQVSCDLAGEAAILDVKSGMYYSLNPVGTHIWKLIQEPRTVSAVREALLEEYDVEPECCEHDLLALLQELADKGLIEVTGEAAP
jgi:hypothetical protein